MASTVSLSKGVFAFKKKKAKSKNDLNNFCTARFWRQEEGRDDPFIQTQTFKNYQKCWSSVNDAIRKFLDETHTKVFEDLIRYVQTVGQSRCRNLLQNSVNANKDIPAACLVTGVNMPDHTSIFDSLAKVVYERVSPHIARLSSRDCSTIKMAIYKMICSLVNKEGPVFYESDSEDELLVSSQGSSPKKKRIKTSASHMTALASWYKETELSTYKCDDENFERTPKKRKLSPKKSMTPQNDEGKGSKQERELHPVVIIIEEIESMPIPVLHDLIFITSEYQKNIPFVFIFGVSTSPSYIHRHLNQEASSFVAMETFQAQPSSSLLSQVIEELLMNSNHHFRVGGKVFKLLLDIFLFHDLSVKNFVSALKFCMLEHFLRGEGSFLCCSRKERKEVLKSLPPPASSSLKKLASYQSCFSDQEKQKMEEESYFVKTVSESLDELERWYVMFCSIVKVLHKIVHSLPGAPLGKQVREVFSMCLSQQISETEEFQSSWKFLSMSSKEELIQMVIEAMKILRETPGAEQLVEKFSEFLEKLLTIDQQATATQESKEAKSPSVIKLKPSDRFHLREKLLGLAKSKSKTPYEELRASVLTCFEHMFISYLKPVQTKAFHEVFFFDSLGSVKYQLLGSLRATITTGLVDPHKYLQCSCCKLEMTEEMVTTLPDLSLCYKLHLECGRLINLYDWLQAFIALIGEEEMDSSAAGPKNKRKKKKAVNEVVQARFIQSVSELQLLGFIKPTKRKTDHVQRLTWGGC